MGTGASTCFRPRAASNHEALQKLQDDVSNPASLTHDPPSPRPPPTTPLDPPTDPPSPLGPPSRPSQKKACAGEALSSELSLYIRSTSVMALKTALDDFPEEVRTMISSVLRSSLFIPASLPDSGIKLYSHPWCGSAQKTRYALAEAGVTWEDVSYSVSYEVFNPPENYEKTIVGQSARQFINDCNALIGNGFPSIEKVPLLEVEGRYLCHHTAIFDYVCRRGGLFPSDSELAYVADCILAHTEDARSHVEDVYFGRKTVENFAKEDLLSKHVGNLERLLGDGDYFIPGLFSSADIAVFDLLTDLYVAICPDILRGFPKLKAFCDRVAARPSIKGFLDSEQYKKLFKFDPSLYAGLCDAASSDYVSLPVKDFKPDGLKLYYWPATGRAQAIRYLLAIGGYSFSDVCFEKQDWDMYDPNGSLLAMGQYARSHQKITFDEMSRERGRNFTTNTPMLEVDGTFYNQSCAIMKYISRRCGMYPDDAEEAHIADIFIYQWMPDWMEVAKLYYGITSVEKFTEEGLLYRHFGYLEEFLGEKEYLIGCNLSVADVCAFDHIYDRFGAMIPDVLHTFPRLRAFYQRMSTIPNLKMYLDSEQHAHLFKFHMRPEFAAVGLPS